MSLVSKTILIFSLLGLSLSVGGYFVQKGVVYPAFESYEEEATRDTIARVRDALAAELNALEVLNVEYSYWDDAYAFAQGLAPDFVDDYLRQAYLLDSNIDLFLIFDSSGNELFRYYEGVTGTEATAIQTLLLEPLSLDHPLLKPATDEQSIRGYLRTRDGLMQMVSYPIVRTSGEGGGVGSLAVGRYLSAESMAELGERVSASVAFYDAQDPVLPESVQQAQRALNFQNKSVHISNSKATPSGFFVVPDVFSRPSAIFKISTRDSIAAIASKTILSSTLFFAGMSLLFMIAAWLFAQRLVIARILRLSDEIDRIRETGDLKVQLETRYQDEIGALSRNFSELTNELSETQDDLEQARDKALEASQLKSEFLARMSHEIRTPMNGVLGMTEVLQNTELSPQQKRMTDTIYESGSSLLHIVNDVLDFSKIEAGKLDVEVSEVDLETLLKGIMATFVHEAANKGLKLDYDVENPPTTQVWMDPVRTKQVLTNLVGNAIKFTQAGTVNVSVRCAPQPNGRIDIRFLVSDTGIGIHAEKLSDIFESFTQEDGSITRNYGGTGLGLAISKQLVELMGGELTVSSTPGEGSRFEFTLTVEKTPEASATGNAENGCDSVLVVDDNRIDQTVAAAMLEHLGYQATVVGSGKEAIEAVAKRPFRAILMDGQMPVMNGCDTCRAIREQEASLGRPRTLIISLSGNADEDDLIGAKAAGMDVCLRKPCSTQELGTALRVLSGAGPIG